MSADRRVRVWKGQLYFYAANAAVATGLGAFAAVRGRVVAAVALLGFAAFQSWRARSVYRRPPIGPRYDDVRERTERAQRLRLSAIVVTTAAVAELILAAVSGIGELWLLGGLMAAGSVLMWVSSASMIRAAGGPSSPAPTAE